MIKVEAFVLPSSTHTFKITTDKKTNPQPKKCNSLWCLNSHTLYTFPTHSRYSCSRISTSSKEYPHTSSMDYQRYTNQTALSMLFFLDVMVQLSLIYITHFIQPLSNNVFIDTFHQPYWKTSAPPTQCILSYSWCHVRTHKHFTWWWHSNCNSFHGRIQASLTH